ncbi:hypothetical protein [Sphingobacterium psychroaquaticum]|uniref:Uncharacterized protein n=1 Tax=Sphingobacterium psychroaquaticum TaxID=561061 RepID=A0A1X7K4R8_9SPHI|nr:hypothetical protein [Sphingobacterium psychroaquaticum]SMG35331.1 hypothetical protein SAMN05660862_2512 [Sphingobacterium psychroaquaticum]
MEIICSNLLCRAKIKSPIAATDSEGTFSGITVQCPRCFKVNKVKDGVYSFDQNGKATLVKRLKELSHSELNRVLEVSKKAQEHDFTFEEFKREIDSLNLSSSSFFPTGLTSHKELRSFIVVLIACILLLQPSTVTSNKHQIIDVPKTEKTVKKKKKEYSEADKAAYEARKEYHKYIRGKSIKPSK